MRSVTEHRDAAVALVEATRPAEMPWHDARGLVLAHDVRALVDIPAWDNSAMDGFAVRAADVADAAEGRPVTLRVVADLPAGTGDRPRVEPGTAARIMTGAPVPPGADAVAPVERVADRGDQVDIEWAAPEGAHIRRVAEDVTRDHVVLKAGHVLGPAQLAALVASGHDKVHVHRRPRIVVIATGNELVPPGQPLPYGGIYNSNLVLLEAAVLASGAEVAWTRTTGDDPRELAVALGDLDGVDAVITSGGVSMGNKDVVKELLKPRALFEFVAVALQPGRPQGLGRLPSGVPLFALPGNPVSSYVSFALFVKPAIDRLRGLEARPPQTRPGVVGVGWEPARGRAQAMPVVWDSDPATGVIANVRPATERGSGSHLVTRLALAQGFALVPREVDVVEPGDTVQVMEMLV